MLPSTHDAFSAAKAGDFLTACKLLDQCIDKETDPAAQENGFPECVDCKLAFSTSIILFDEITPDIGKPDPIAFPQQTMSGTNE